MTDRPMPDSPAPPPPAEDRDGSILREQLAYSCRFLSQALVLSMVTALVIDLVYAYFNGWLPALSAWVAVLVSITALRFGLARRFRYQDPTFPLRRFAVAFVLAAGVAGVCWSMPGTGLVPGIAALARPAFVTTAAVVAAVGGYSLFPYFPAYAAFVLGSCVPTLVAALASGDLMLRQIGIALVAFVTLAMTAGLRLSRSHRELIVTRLDLEDTRRRAQSASDAKSRFLANMSHELRTPLNGVLGMADLLLRTSLDESQQRQAATIARSGRTLLAILTDILDISKIEAGKLTVVARDFDLTGAVEEVDSLFRPRATEKGLDFRIIWRPQAPRAVRGDRVRLVQVLGNLVANAVKFTERGSIEVRILSAAGASAEAPRVRCEVVDTGIGLTPEQCTRVFDSFEQADDGVARRFGGTGLGLAIARQLVVAQGGAIGVDSEAGAGATFWFELPYAKCVALGQDTGPQRALPPRTPLPPLATPGATILVVEDNPANREVMSAMLAALGLKSVLAGDGEEALARLANRRFDLVLMDCEMPRLDGFETTRRLRTLEAGAHPGQRIPIVAITAHAVDGYRERCMAAGMDDYLTKPITIERLRAGLARHLEAPVPQAG